MKIIVKTFSSVKMVCGFAGKQMEIRDKSSVSDVMQLLSNEFNELANMKDKLLLAVNEEYCDRNRTLKDGDTLAIFPPVSGG